MNVFELLGVIAINNKGANKSIDETSKKAHGLHNGMTNAFNKIGKSALALGKTVGIGMTAIKTVGEAVKTYLMKASIGAYAEFEQLEGGVKKLFGDDIRLCYSDVTSYNYPEYRYNNKGIYYHDTHKYELAKDYFSYANNIRFADHKISCNYFTALWECGKIKDEEYESFCAKNNLPCHLTATHESHYYYADIIPPAEMHEHKKKANKLIKEFIEISKTDGCRKAVKLALEIIKTPGYTYTEISEKLKSFAYPHPLCNIGVSIAGITKTQFKVKKACYHPSGLMFVLLADDGTVHVYNKNGGMRILSEKAKDIYFNNDKTFSLIEGRNIIIYDKKLSKELFRMPHKKSQSPEKAIAINI